MKYKTKIGIGALFCILISSFYVNSTSTAWVNNGTPICTAPENKYDVGICPDGNGGAYIVWADNRNGNPDIYLQRVDREGNPLWVSNGIAVCNHSADQARPKIISDGQGGAIIAWQDNRNPSSYDIYAQRIASNGNQYWTGNGVQLVSGPSNQDWPEICSDGAAGAIVTWQHRISETNNNSQTDIYAQRIYANGTVAWTSSGENGTLIANRAGYDRYPVIINDGYQGAIIAWGHIDGIFAQRVNGDGDLIWATNGSIISNTGDEGYPVICTDGSHGVIAIWDVYINTQNDLYGQRLDPAGNALWTLNGTPIITEIDDQEYPEVISDGSGGAIFCWQDRRSGSDVAIYVQKIDSSGNSLWVPNGTLICNFPEDKSNNRITSDGSGGCGIVWYAYYPNVTYSDVYAQRVYSNGTIGWGANGTAISNAENQQGDCVITGSENGEFIMAWEDERDGDGDIDIYAHGTYVFTPGDDPNTDIGLIIGLSIGIPAGIIGGILVLYYFYGYKKELSFMEFIKKPFKKNETR